MAEKENRVAVEVKKEAIKHGNIYAALSAFQGELKPMAKSGHVEFPSSKGGVVKFDYTPLGEIMTAIYPLLAKHGLSVRHEIQPGTPRSIEAILTHETYKQHPPIYAVEGAPETMAHEPGSVIKTGTQGLQKFESPVENEIRSGPVNLGAPGDMKEVGAAITYARRYTLTMVLGISSEDDKDAELLEQSAKNAIQTVYDRFKAGVEKAKTVAEVEKSMNVLQKDLKSLEDGKAPALGLAKEQYQELIRIGEARVEAINNPGQKTIE